MENRPEAQLWYGQGYRSVCSFNGYGHGIGIVCMQRGEDRFCIAEIRECHDERPLGCDAITLGRVVEIQQLDPQRSILRPARENPCFPRSKRMRIAIGKFFLEGFAV